MDKPSWLQKLTFYTLFIPIRFYFLLFLAAGFLGWWWIGTQKPLETNAITVLLLLLAKLTAFIILALLVLSFLSVMVPFTHFVYQKKNKRVKAILQNSPNAKPGHRMQQMEMTVEPLYQPLFGFLKYRLLYDQHELSPKFSLAEQRRGLYFFKPQKEGCYDWPLPTIREYEVDKLVVYFEDIFQFFSFSTAVKIHQSFFTKPGFAPLPDDDFLPKKSVEEFVRIDELRKVQGEYLNYKHFEANDDVRRIVWKIYAKNKELVVRTQEIQDPFASHTYYYCSFYDGIGVEGETVMQTRGLNFYKSICWSIYEQVKKTGSSVKFLPDQEIPNRTFSDTNQQVEYGIAVSRWHKQNPLLSYVNLRDASVLCIHSLTDPVALQSLLESSGNQLTIVFVKLSKSVQKQRITQWIRWLFIQEEKDKDKTSMIAWRLSPKRKTVLHQEEKIEAVLNQFSAKTIVPA